jgi:UDP-glucose 4-epimerase
MPRPADTYVVTGASGFIGSAFCRSFRELGHSVTGVTRRPHVTPGFPVRVIDYSVGAVADLVRELQPSVLIHAAGPASVGASMEDPGTDFSGSVLLFQRILDGVRRSELRPRVVFVSSAAIYGNPEKLPMPERAKSRPISPYGHHKVMCETLAAEYTACFGVPILVLRPFSVFGSFQRRLLVWDLFRKFRDDAEVVIDGTGKEARDYIHIDDLAAQVAAVLRSVLSPHEVVNISAGRSVKVRELAQIVGRLLGSPKAISFTGRQRLGDPREWRADMSHYELITGAEVRLDLEQRLDQVLRQWRG